MSHLEEDQPAATPEMTEPQLKLSCDTRSNTRLSEVGRLRILIKPSNPLETYNLLFASMNPLAMSRHLLGWVALALLVVTIPAIPKSLHQYLIGSFSIRVPTASYWYCTYIGGPYFCGPKGHSHSRKVASLSNTVTSTARDVRDKVNLLNSASISFLRKVFQKLEVIRLVLTSIADGEDKYLTTSAYDRFGDLVQTISEGFSGLQAQIDDAIPLARRGSDFAASVGAQFAEENMQLRKFKAGIPIWKRLMNFGSWGSQSLNRNIAMTSASASTLRSIATKLEDLRATLVTFEGNAKHFRAEIIGNHVACRELAIEDEFRAMSQVIARFNQLSEAAAIKSKTTRLILPTPTLEGVHRFTT
ncbi:uncharacterized protein MELLADRAFT_107341 [Melampsora larici-populina 98AG31]|uniref:Uncharacterized protein n=1 Tax=Melampsora larici-populina (strain 98AG31 / pathotype 3-4-7) TaxID=747676 RepID=F4RPG5_MELLP|nr:uncharacterized protein MELLADRAFT_107341 [Melampsora larici-populina 98AG31]EGG05525.1 hypothetical protein MELLADRAFT_107341 [Melampsora larici-populina 98AG31]